MEGSPVSRLRRTSKRPCNKRPRRAPRMAVRGVYPWCSSARVSSVSGPLRTLKLTARDASSDRYRSKNRLAPLPPKFVHGIELHGSGSRHVLEAAPERIVVTHRRPIDSHSGIDGRLDVLGIDVAILRPAVIDGVRPAGVSGADDRAALHAAAREERELLRPVVASRGR